jgi:hypothetical protein
VRPYQLRILRFLLQLIIAAFYGLALFIWLRPPFPLGVLVGVSAFFLFLFLLTLLLREHTEIRLVAGRKLNPQVLGSFVALSGAGVSWMSWLIATGHTMSNSWRGKILSNIIELVGPWPPALVFLGLGLHMLWLGYRVYRSKETPS